jgi:hypothetical protein
MSVRTSGKNHTTGYSQVRWEMIWHFALCVVPTSVLLQGDGMILRDTQRPVCKDTFIVYKFIVDPSINSLTV